MSAEKIELGGCDPYFFIENQIMNVNQTWDLFGPKLNEKGEFGEMDKDTPIVSGILPEQQLDVIISNSFESPNSGLANKIGSQLGSISSTIDDFSQTGAYIEGMMRNFHGNKTDKAINDFKNLVYHKDEKTNHKLTVGDTLNLVSRFTGSKTVSAFDHIKVYKGTNIKLTIPPLVTRLICGVPYKRKYGGGDKKPYVDVRDAIAEMNRYFSGNFTKVTGLDNIDFINNSDSDLLNVTGEIVSSSEHMFGLQLAPSGYKPIFNLVKEYSELPGTFTLRFGNYCIPNLLVTAFNFNISNIRVRQGKRYSDDGQLGNLGNTETFREAYTELVKVPLYADISIELEPATYITPQLLDAILNGNNEHIRISFLDNNSDEDNPNTDYQFSPRTNQYIDYNKSRNKNLQNNNNTFNNDAASTINISKLTNSSIPVESDSENTTEVPEYDSQTKTRVETLNKQFGTSWWNAYTSDEELEVACATIKECKTPNELDQVVACYGKDSKGMDLYQRMIYEFNDDSEKEMVIGVNDYLQGIGVPTDKLFALTEEEYNQRLSKSANN